MEQDRSTYEENKTRTKQLDDRRSAIRKLNDHFRRTLADGYVTLTPGVRGLGREALDSVLHQVRTHEEFEQVNDPYAEHDFGAFECAGQRIFWKIDCYDSNLEYGSPDAADPAVTTRVLTIMLASEY